MDNQILNKARQYVEGLFEALRNKDNVYHNIDHTLEVVENVKEIGVGEGLTEEELEIVTLAAWFHDTGYCIQSEGHEEVSANYARGFLNVENYPPDKINEVVKCVMATRVPQNPDTLLEKVICDADLAHIGRDDFEVRNNLFRQEYEIYFGKELSEKEWLEKSIDFFSRHRFFTEYSNRKYSAQKEKNIERLKKQLALLDNDKESK